MKCPNCNKEMEHTEADPEVGILTGGFYCWDCKIDIADHEVDEDLEDTIK